MVGSTFEKMFFMEYTCLFWKNTNRCRLTSSFSGGEMAAQPPLTMTKVATLSTEGGHNATLVSCYPCKS
jgi:hypothetical protein